ncbi:MAG: metallophosphoesterase [Polyangiaceae bacterium]|nr:metallophosphoesterase [Polyangiaceae bacterium]
MIRFSKDPTEAERQMQAVIFCLVAFAYIDANFSRSEKDFIAGHIRKLVVARLEQHGQTGVGEDVVARLAQHYGEILEHYERDILSHFTESVCGEETSEQFVLLKLKLGCFELFRTFDQEGRAALLQTVDELMHADGVVHPNEQAFRDEVMTLVDREIELDEAEVEPVASGSILFDEVRQLVPRVDDHPFLRSSEWDYASDKDTFALQCQGDLDLVREVMERLDAQRAEGKDRLAGARDFAAFAGGPSFLDGHVYVVPPKPDHELLVIGDLHGCYSCLKAALLQADFFGKLEAHKQDPQKNPPIDLVLLGDYIDRGRFSYAGVLRTAMQLKIHAPEHVHMLRGNHEYYVEIHGRVVAPVRPCEAMDALKPVAADGVFGAYMRLFDALPNSLVFDRTFFVHGGLPREATLAERWQGIHSLNDPAIRFEMLWSDPAKAEVIPHELQKDVARFPFGSKQFQSFLGRIGCRTLVRGHERVIEGFRKIYDEPEGTLLSLFSAGGSTNADLPERSNYREVTPMALTVRFKGGVTQFAPFAIDFARYNDPRYNNFFGTKLAS